jgi:hypothetical protein
MHLSVCNNNWKQQTQFNLTSISKFLQLFVPVKPIPEKYFFEILLEIKLQQFDI